MRNFLALVFSAGLVVLLFLVVTANHALNTISEPDVIISVLNDAEAYDYLYDEIIGNLVYDVVEKGVEVNSGICLLYTSPSPRDATLSRMPSSA